MNVHNRPTEDPRKIVEKRQKRLYHNRAALARHLESSGKTAQEEGNIGWHYNPLPDKGWPVIVCSERHRKTLEMKQIRCIP